MGQEQHFKSGLSPRTPPVFYGRANEDVDTWIAKVGDFLYLTEANARQQVAYAATLLQEAAADWWVALLRERAGRRPDDWAELQFCWQNDLAVLPGWTGRGQSYAIYAKANRRQYAATPQDLSL